MILLFRECFSSLESLEARYRISHNPDAQGGKCLSFSSRPNPGSLPRGQESASFSKEPRSLPRLQAAGASSGAQHCRAEERCLLGHSGMCPSKTWNRNILCAWLSNSVVNVLHRPSHATSPLLSLLWTEKQFAEDSSPWVS